MINYNRIFKNTVILYGQIILSSIILLLNTRFLLLNLGESEFGVYNLISGFIAGLAFINIAMSVSTQRFLSFYLGKGDIKLLNYIFNSSFVLHLIIAVVTSGSLLVIKSYLFNNVFNIETSYLSSAEFVYYTLILSTFLTIIRVPLDGLLTAYENMKVLAIFSLLDSLVKLISSILIFYVSFKLEFYSTILTICLLLILICKFIYCRKAYKHIRLKVKNIKSIYIKEMFSFSAWNSFGALANVSKNHGIGIVLNVFFGAWINAAYGIANQVNNLLLVLTSSIQRAISPQITKSEGANQREDLVHLSFTQCRVTFLLLSIVSFPLLIVMPDILKLWLTNVPKYSIEFCRFIFLMTLVNSLSVGLQVAIQSVGKIQLYQFVISIVLFLNIPISYYILFKGGQPIDVFITLVIVEILALFVRLLFAKKLVKISITQYFKKVFINSLAILIFLTTIYNVFISFEFNFIYKFIISFIIGLLVVIFVGFNINERRKILSILNNVKSFIKKT